MYTSKLKQQYSKIQKQLFYMIPEKWDKIYLYASVIEGINHLETGEMFFYYFPKSILKKNPINSYEIPTRFSLDENSYLKLASNLYNYIKQLREQTILNSEKPWTNITIKIEKCKFKVEFYYDELSTIEDFTEQKHVLWAYQNLKLPIESFSKKQKNIIYNAIENKILENRELNIYEEPMYKKPVKNIVSYDKEDTVQQYRSIEISKKQMEKAKQKATIIPLEQKTQTIYINSKTNKKIKSTKIKNTKIEIDQPSIANTSKPKNLDEIIKEQIEAQKHAIKTQILNPSLHVS